MEHSISVHTKLQKAAGSNFFMYKFLGKEIASLLFKNVANVLEPQARRRAFELQTFPHEVILEPWGVLLRWHLLSHWQYD